MDHHNTHTHSHLREASRQTTRRLSLSLFLTLAFVVIEAGAGIFANSLALLTDAAHNLTDVIALGLTWSIFRVAYVNRRVSGSNTARVSNPCNNNRGLH